MVDGFDNNDPAVGAVGATFSQEAVREFQVLTNSYSAEFGQGSAGGVVNIVTRSGTNDVRGAAFSYYQVRQTDRGVDVAVVTDGPVDLQGLADAIEGGLRKAGVANATAAVRNVSAISKHPETGKTRRFIPLE
jgi:outer membrane receptor protein involved in Fe transport